MEQRGRGVIGFHGKNKESFFKMKGNLGIFEINYRSNQKNGRRGWPPAIGRMIHQDNE